MPAQTELGNVRHSVDCRQSASFSSIDSVAQGGEEDGKADARYPAAALRIFASRGPHVSSKLDHRSRYACAASQAVAKLSYPTQALTGLERLSNFLFMNEPSVALHTLELIDEAISILRHHRLIGRLAESDLRELVISLSSYDEAYDAVLILSIQHQREAGSHTAISRPGPICQAHFFN